MPNKIKNLIDNIPNKSALGSMVLSHFGLSRQEQAHYVKNGWLFRINRGVYSLGQDIRLFPSLYCLEKYNKIPLHLGAFTALELKDIFHYGNLGSLKTFIYLNDKLPDWIFKLKFDSVPFCFRNNKFGELGLYEYDFHDFSLKVSSPERAFLECLELIPKYANPMDLYYIMEQLNNLRPSLLMNLLERCSSFKVRRLFLYMAEKAKHPWLDGLNKSKLFLGSGDRSITPGGVYIKDYKIVIPKELAEYE